MLRLAAADAGEEAAGALAARGDAGQDLALDVATKSKYVPLSLEEEEKNGISRSTPIPTNQMGGSARPLLSRATSSNTAIVGPIEEHSPMLISGERTGYNGEVTVEDLGDDYRGGMAASDLLSQASIDSADITDFYGPGSGHFAGFPAADLPPQAGDEAEAGGDDYDQLVSGSRESSNVSLLGASSPAVGRRGSLQLPIAEQSAWQLDLHRCAHLPNM